MSKLISAIPLLLMSSWALAAMEEGANAPPPEGVNMIYVVIFLVAFFGMIVGFFIYMWYLDRQKKAKGGQ